MTSNKILTIGDLRKAIEELIKELEKEIEFLTGEDKELQKARYQAMIGHLKGWKSITDIEDAIVINDDKMSRRAAKLEILKVVLEKIDELEAGLRERLDELEKDNSHIIEEFGYDEDDVLADSTIQYRSQIEELRRILGDTT